jgi:hypothetical protein
MYYPKSKIISDQFTNGEELVYKSNGIFYTGYYHILANNTVYTGKNPNDGIPELLVYPKESSPRLEDIESINNPLTDQSQTGNFTFDITGTEYDNIRKKRNITPPTNSLLEPKPSLPLINYPSCIRYFVKRINNNIFIEVNKSTYDSIASKDKKWNWAIYIPFELPWTTGGNTKEQIYQINRNIVLLTEQRLKLYGFSNYITNYTEFSI